MNAIACVLIILISIDAIHMQENGKCENLCIDFSQKNNIQSFLQRRKLERW